MRFSSDSDLLSTSSSADGGCCNVSDDVGFGKTELAFNLLDPVYGRLFELMAGGGEFCTSIAVSNRDLWGGFRAAYALRDGPVFSSVSGPKDIVLRSPRVSIFLFLGTIVTDILSKYVCKSVPWYKIEDTVSYNKNVCAKRDADECS